MEGKEFMCNCGGPRTTSDPPSSLLSSSGAFTITDLDKNGDNPTQMVKVEYIGPRAESFSIRSRVIHDKMYRFGNNPQHKDQTVFMQDAEFLLGLRTGDQPDFRILTMSATMDTRDPAAALGQAIIA